METKQCINEENEDWMKCVMTSYVNSMWMNVLMKVLTILMNYYYIPNDEERIILS